MHTSLKKSALILFALLAFCNIQGKVGAGQALKHEKHCLGSWIEDDALSMTLEFIIRKYNLDRESLVEFVRERGGLSQKQEQRLISFSETIQPSQTMPTETMIRLVIDGIDPKNFRFLQKSDTPFNTDDPGLNTKFMTPSADDPDDHRSKWIYRGPTQPTIEPKQPLPFDKFLKLLSRKLHVADNLQPAVYVYSSMMFGNEESIIHGLSNAGIYLGYIKEQPYPVIIKFITPITKFIENEALALWVAHAMGIGPEFLGTLEHPDFPGYTAVVFQATSGLFDYLQEIDRELLDSIFPFSDIKLAMLDRIKEFGMTRYSSTMQVLMTEDSIALIDSQESNLFRNISFGLQLYREDALDCAA